MTQLDRARAFRALHDAPEAFVIANAWDAGSAKLLTALGFKALATSSGAQAGILGRVDGKVNREEALAHAKAIVEATELPVSADLEKGFGDSPDDAACTITLAAAIGLVGGSIEDASGDPSRPLYDSSHAAERIAAAAQAARSCGFPFVLTARTENYLRGNPNLDDTIRRLQAFEAAGADVLMAPGLPDLDAVRAVCAAVSEAGELHGRHQGEIVHRGGTGGCRREADQPGDVVVPRRDDRIADGGDRGARPRHIQIS